MTKKKNIKELTVSLIHQGSEIYKGPFDDIPDSISKENIDRVKLFDKDKQVFASIDYQDLVDLLEKDL